MTYYNSLKFGFTLVELMVTLAILMVITVGVVIQYRRLTPEQTLENASDTVRSAYIDLRTAAVAAQQCCGGITPAGYGLSITLDGSPDNTILFFADQNADNLYDSGDTLLATTVLQDNVDIINCEHNSTFLTTGVCTISLSTGTTNTLAYNGSSAIDTITIALQESAEDTGGTLIIYPETLVIE